MAENMVKAGRASLTFGGDWDSSVEYNRLVGVRYSNNLFFSRKTVPIGTIPEDGEFWFLAIEGISNEEWEGLLNGTIQVGDSAKLGGKDASEYALDTDLANYLPLSGGTVKDLTVHSDGEKDATFKVNNDVRDIFMRVYADGRFRLYDATNSKNIILSNLDGTATFNGTATGNLPLSGGKITSTNNSPLQLDSTNDATIVLLQFLRNGTSVGHLGFNGNKPCARVDGTFQELLHTGNKPTGTYTGNGDATERSIETGSTNRVFAIGCKNGSTYNFAVVSAFGYIGKIGNEVVCGVDASVSQGKILVRTTSELFNASGVNYNYYALSV